MHVEFLKDIDIEECNNFHNAAYGSNRTLEQWHWQFDRLLGGKRPFVVAKEGGRIVGTQALMPIKMLDEAGDIMTAKSEETLIDPSMRGKGLFEKMYEPLKRYAREQGVNVIWGFTPAKKAFENVGFYIPGNTSQLVHPLSMRAVTAFDNSMGSGLRRLFLTTAIRIGHIYSSTRLAFAKNQTKGIELKILETPPVESEILCKDFINGWGGQTILRDQAYLQWRYYNNPKVRASLIGAYHQDKLIGWLAYSLDDSSMGYIVDAIVLKSDDATDVLHALMLHAVMALRAAGAVAIRSWHLNRHPFDQLIAKVASSLGFYMVHRGEPVVLYSSNFRSKSEALLLWSEWFVTRAYTQGEAG